MVVRQDLAVKLWKFYTGEIAQPQITSFLLTTTKEWKLFSQQVYVLSTVEGNPILLDLLEIATSPAKRLSSSNLCWMTYLYPPILLSLIKLLLNSLMCSLLGLVPIPILASVGSILLYNTGRYSSWMSEPRNDNLSWKLA